MWLKQEGDTDSQKESRGVQTVGRHVTQTVVYYVPHKNSFTYDSQTVVGNIWLTNKRAILTNVGEARDSQTVGRPGSQKWGRHVTHKQ